MISYGILSLAIHDLFLATDKGWNTDHLRKFIEFFSNIFGANSIEFPFNAKDENRFYISQTITFLSGATQTFVDHWILLDNQHPGKCLHIDVDKDMLSVYCMFLNQYYDKFLERM